MKWRLQDREGMTLKIVEAEDRAGADLVGLKTFPGKYHRAVDPEADLTRLKEAYKASGLDEEQAEIAARGRGQ